MRDTPPHHHHHRGRRRDGRSRVVHCAAGLPGGLPTLPGLPARRAVFLGRWGARLRLPRPGAYWFADQDHQAWLGTFSRHRADLDLPRGQGYGTAVACHVGLIDPTGIRTPVRPCRGA